MNNRPHLLNLLNYQLFKMKNKKYLQTVDKLISIKNQNIKINYLDKFIQSKYANEIFKINQDNSISFLHHQNLINFEFDKKDLTPPMRLILNINIKNQQCYELIQTIVKLQYKFIQSNSCQDLKYISHKEILSYHKKYFSTSLVASNISTISHNTFYRDKNNNVFKLSYLIPKQHFIIYLKCRYIINQNTNISDVKLSFYLQNIYNIKATKSQIYTIRKRYFIPNKKNRTQNIYLEYEKNYTLIYSLTYENLKRFKTISCVYELLTYNFYQYSYKNSKTFYIGSTNDTQKRLTSYINGYAHTQRLNDFIKINHILFRIIASENYKDLERDILKAFFLSFGEYPLMNVNRIL